MKLATVLLVAVAALASTATAAQDEQRNLRAENGVDDARRKFPHDETYAPRQKEPRRLAEEGRFHPDEIDTFAPPADEMRALEETAPRAVEIAKSLFEAAKPKTFAPPAPEPM